MRVKGFTLVELILSSVIISIALTGTIIVINKTVRASVDPLIQQQSITIANSYLEEIMTKDYPTVLPCPAPPLSRANYLNVCDYDGLINNGVIDQFGNPVPNLSNYTINVSVNSAASLGSLVPGTDVVRVDVTVTNSNSPVITISSYRTNF